MLLEYNLTCFVGGRCLRIQTPATYKNPRWSSDFEASTGLYPKRSLVDFDFPWAGQGVFLDRFGETNLQFRSGFFWTPLLVGGFRDFLFLPLPGEMIQFDEHIFQMGWNHQLVYGGCAGA